MTVHDKNKHPSIPLFYHQIIKRKTPVREDKKMTNNNTSEVKKVTPEMIRKAKFTAVIYMVTVAFLLLDSGLWIFEKYSY